MGRMIHVHVRLLLEVVHQFFESLVALEVEFGGRSTAHGAIVLALMLKCVGVNTVVAAVHHVVVQVLGARRRDLERLVTTRCYEGRKSRMESTIDNSLSKIITKNALSNHRKKTHQQ